MTHIKVGIDEKPEDPDEKVLLANENDGKTQLNETEEHEEMLNYTAKIV